MTVVRCRPITDLFNIKDEKNRLLDGCFGNMLSRGKRYSECNLDADVEETDSTFLVSVEVPGMEQKDLKITVRENVLTLKGEKKREAEENETPYYVSERSFGSFERSFTLPTNVQADKVTAKYRNGVLSILLPKVEEAKPRDVEVKFA